MQLHPQKYKYFPKIRERARENDLNKRLFFGYLRLEQIWILMFMHKGMEGNNVTINDVAKAAGVSKGTVDRVLNHRGSVSPEKEKKVLEIAELLNYQPNKAGVALAAQKKKYIIGIILFGESNPFFNYVLEGNPAKELKDYSCYCFAYRPRDGVVRYIASFSNGNLRVPIFMQLDWN